MSSSSGQDSSINGHIRKGKTTNFGHTCNLLSQYVKEKGTLRDLNLEIDGKIESLEAIVRPSSCNSTTTVDKQLDKGKSVLITAEIQPSVVDLVVEEKAASSSKEATKTEAKNAQLTMFYGGRILVFDDFPMDKVREVVSLARKSSSKMSYGISPSTNVVLPEKASNFHGINNNGVLSSNITLSSSIGLPPRPQANNNSRSKNVKISSNNCEDKSSVHYCHEAGASSSEANGSDLPIARRLTIHRFLAKRKDRAAARGPYQVQEQPSSSNNNQKGDEHLELKL